jgi:hypothetical protein
LEDPQWLELRVIPGTQEVNPDPVPIGAKTGLEYLELKEIRADGDGWIIRFRGLQRRRYQTGLQPVFIAMDVEEQLVEENAAWLLQKISWRPEQERKNYVTSP